MTTTRACHANRLSKFVDRVQDPAVVLRPLADDKHGVDFRNVVGRGEDALVRTDVFIAVVVIVFVVKISLSYASVRPQNPFKVSLEFLVSLGLVEVKHFGDTAAHHGERCLRTRHR